MGLHVRNNACTPLQLQTSKFKICVAGVELVCGGGEGGGWVLTGLLPLLDCHPPSPSKVLGPVGAAFGSLGSHENLVDVSLLVQQ